MTKPTDILISSLESYIDCEEAIERIRMDYTNTVGGHKAFFSGWQTELTEKAKRKIAAIERRAVSLLPDDD